MTPPLHRRIGRALGHTLKARLVGVFLALALGTTAVFFAGTREWFSTGWRELARPLVADYLDRLAAEIGSPPDRARAQALVQRLPLSIRIDGPQLQWDSHPQRVDRGPHDPAWRSLLERRSADGHVIRFGLGNWQDWQAWQREDRSRRVAWLTLAGLLVLTAGAYLYARRLLRPVEDIHAGALRYGAGDFSQTIPQRRRDELGELAGQVNAMAASLQRMLEGQRGLLLAISHELRSPLTRARLNAELLAESAERQALLRDLGQMRDLIADLLEGERLAGGAAVLQRESTDLNALLRDQVAESFPGRDLDLVLDPALPPLPLDRARLQLLLRNLLDNALRHAAGAPVELRTALVDGEVWLTVRDHGPGVEPSQLDRLGEAFYRPDAARSRSAGGVGLGLYLCRLVASSHGGRLVLRNAAPGLAVSLCLPLPNGSSAPPA
ncbi:MAG: HAMP domain-containing histidine kinase [Burkholderiaceae bacterium]|nr:HAMP domain-containing histidine kinase [Burkholderiaceae bacterium]